MSINFPLSPSPNEIYSYNGLSWQWNGSYWQSFPPSSGATGVVRSIIASTGLSANTTTGDVTLIVTGSTGSNFTGGTVTGATSFTGGLSANTISATTYNNYPGSSSSYCVPTFYVSSISGCSPVTILTPLNAVGGLNVTGTTNFTQTVDFSGGLTATTISATTYQNLPLYNAGLLTDSSSWVNNNDGTVTLPAAYVSLYNQTSYPNTLQIYQISAATSGSGFLPALSNNDTNYIVVEYNTGTPRWNILTDNSTINGETVVLTHIIYRASNFLHVLDFGNEGVALPNKLNDRVVAIDRFGRESGFSLGLSGSTGVVTLTSGVAWNGTNRQSLVAVNSQDDVFFQSFHSGGTWVYTTTANTINNIYYDNGTDRVDATAGKYLVNWYFRGQEINDHLYEVWGNDEYDSVSDAQLSVEPSLPELITSHAFLTGRIIILKGESTGLTESAFVQVFQSTQVTQHNDLTAIQGGGAGEYYHLTSSQYTNNAYTNTNNNFSTDQTITGNLVSNSVSATTYYNLPISGVTDGSGISTSITNGNLTITATGGGGGGLTFQQVQMIAFLTS